ncbi:MAG: Gfo/Idh/MocA family protein [Pseudomonadota bacterium]
MRVVVVGLGIQGRKRQRIAGVDAVAAVDPAVAEAGFRRIEDVPLGVYDGALVCVPDDAKPALVSSLLERGKHVLVEKPLIAPPETLAGFKALAERHGTVCYTAYNHRFEPHIVRAKEALGAGKIGTVYLARFFYGNGTAADVRNSPWRDRGAGVLTDLGSHLIDMVLFLFGRPTAPFEPWAANRFENRAFDHVAFASRGQPMIELEASLISWRNHFTADIYGERGSVHISSLCKWGPTSFTLRGRVLPSGRPDEETVTLVEADPTWAAEYAHWKTLCTAGGPSNTDNDLWIAAALDQLVAAPGCSPVADESAAKEIKR